MDSVLGVTEGIIIQAEGLIWTRIIAIPSNTGCIDLSKINK